MFPFRFIGMAMFAVGIILFAPFFFRFLFFALIVGFAFRMISRYRWARYGYGYEGCGRQRWYDDRHAFGNRRYDDEGIVPSDF